MAQKRLKIVFFDVIRQNDVILERAKCFHCVFGHSFLGIEGKIITKSGIKGVIFLTSLGRHSLKLRRFGT